MSTQNETIHSLKRFFESFSIKLSESSVKIDWSNIRWEFIILTGAIIVGGVIAIILTISNHRKKMKILAQDNDDHKPNSVSSQAAVAQKIIPAEEEKNEIPSPPVTVIASVETAPELAEEKHVTIEETEVGVEGDMAPIASVSPVPEKTIPQSALHEEEPIPDEPPPPAATSAENREQELKEKLYAVFTIDERFNVNVEFAEMLCSDYEHKAIALFKTRFPQSFDVSIPRISVSDTLEHEINELLRRLHFVEQLAQRHSIRFSREYYYQKSLAQLNFRKYEHLEYTLLKSLRLFNDDEYFMLNIALLYLHQHKAEDAIRYLEKLVEHNPLNLFAQLRLAETLLHEDRLIEAKKAIQRILHIDENNITARIYEADLDVRGGFLTSGEKKFQELLKSVPHNGEIYYYYGNLFFNHYHNIKTARDQYIKAFDCGYYNFDLLCRLGEVYFLEHDYAMTIKYLGQLDQSLDETPHYLALLGIARMHSGLMSRAYEDLRRIQDTDSNDYWVIHALAVRSYIEKEYDDALSFANAAAGMTRKKADIQWLLAKIYIKQANYGKALEALNAAQDVWSMNGEFAYDKGYALLKDERYEEAVIAFKAALARGYRNEAVLKHLAFTYSELDDVPQAVATYKELMKLNPMSTDAYNNIGVMFAERNKYEKALSYFRQALDIDPTCADAHYNINLLYEEVLSKKAATHIERFYEITGEY